MLVAATNGRRLDLVLAYSYSQGLGMCRGFVPRLLTTRDAPIALVNRHEHHGRERPPPVVTALAPSLNDCTRVPQYGSS